MATEHDPMLMDFQLEDGRDVQVRRVSASVVKAMIEDRHKRGYEDLMMDALVGAPLVLRVDGAPASEDFMETLTLSDISAVWSKANGVDSPNASAPSSNGTPPTEKARKGARENRQSNG